MRGPTVSLVPQEPVSDLRTPGSPGRRAKTAQRGLGKVWAGIQKAREQDGDTGGGNVGFCSARPPLSPGTGCPHMQRQREVYSMTSCGVSKRSKGHKQEVYWLNDFSLSYWVCASYSVRLLHWNKEDSWYLAKTLTNTTLLIPHDWSDPPPQHTHTEHFSKMPVGFPSIQFKSDTMYLELSSDSHKLKTQSHKTVLTSDADPKSQVVSYISDILTINWILYDLLHGSSNLLEWFIQFRETLLPEYYQRYNKRHKWTARQSNT